MAGTYKNILSSRINILNDDQVSILKKEVAFNTNFGIRSYDRFEIHLYDNDNNLLNSSYDASYVYPDTVPEYIEFNLVDNLSNLSGIFGNVNIKMNFFRNFVGGFLNTNPIITKISPSRLEARIKTPTGDISGLSDQYLHACFLNFVAQHPETRDLSKELYVLNFGDNKTIPIVSYLQDRWNVPDSPHSIILKFSEPLSRDIKVGKPCWISQPIIQSVSFPLSITSLFTPEVEIGNQLLGPNFFINFNRDHFSGTTDYESYDTLLGAKGDTKRDVINKYFSGSLQGVNLGIDFRNYNEFIHFSSAEERLRNFRYKLKLIEQYDTQITNLTTKYSSSTAYQPYASVTASAEFITNRKKWQGRRDQLVGSFDPYEHYLYFDSASYATSSYGEFTPTTWPKTNSIKPFILSSVGSSEATEWFGNVSDHTGQLYSASLYDLNNPHILRNTIPAHIREKDENEDYVSYVDMMGQHYDILYNYVNHMGKLYNRDERLYRGLSKDLIFDSLKSFGWDAVSGFNLDDLWTYALGTNPSGSYVSSSLDPNSIGQSVITASNAATLASLGYPPSVPRGDITKEIWNRVLTNLPYLYKTKGTKRGIQALMNCYGISPTILNIKEYGGSELTQSANSYFQNDRFNYALNFDGSGYIECDWNPVNQLIIPPDKQGMPRTQELRVRLKGDSDYALLVSTGSKSGTDAGVQWGVFSEYSSSNISNLSNYGRLTFALSGSNGYASASTAYLPLYDGDWWNISLATSEPAPSNVQLPIKTQKWVLKVKKTANSPECMTPNCLITHSGSAIIDASTSPQMSAGTTYRTYNRAWALSGSAYLRIGGAPMNLRDSSLPSKMFSGSMQEYRQYMEQLNDDILDAHTLSPLSYIGNTYTSSFDLLVRRYTLGSDLRTPDRATYTAISSSHPDQGIVQYSTGSLGGSTSASAVGFTAGTGYLDFEETYCTRVPDIVGTRPINQKIRIEDNELFTQSLSPDMTFQTSSYELFPIDSDKVSISFDPINNIDQDIAYQFGGLSFGDFVGDPRDQFKTQYSGLTNLQHIYKKKFNDSYNMYAFFRLLKYFDKALFLQMEKLLPARARSFIGVTIRSNMLERPKKLGVNMAGSFTSNSPVSSTPQMDFNISNYNSSNTIISMSKVDLPYYNNLQTGISASIFSSKVTGRYPQYEGSLYSWKNQGIPAQGIGDAEIGKDFIIGSFSSDDNPYWLRDPIAVNVSGSPLSELKQIQNGYFTSSEISVKDADISASLGTYESTSFAYARVQDYLPTSINNLFYNGCTLFSEFYTTAGSQSGIYAIGSSSNDFSLTYQSSSNVPDGRAVIEVFTTTNNVYYVRTPGLDKTAAASPDITVPFNYAGNDKLNPNKPGSPASSVFTKRYPLNPNQAGTLGTRGSGDQGRVYFDG